MTVKTQGIPRQFRDFSIPERRKNTPDYLTWQSFKNRYLGREDGFTYEWTNGKIEKTPTTKTIQQMYIWDNLDDFSRICFPKNQIQGKLCSETDILLGAEKHRRPDIAFLTKEQVWAGRENEIQVPAFVAEIISPNDKAEKVARKTKDYLEAGGRVVWNIYSQAGEVVVRDCLGGTATCSGDQICSAELTMPGFAMPAAEV